MNEVLQMVLTIAGSVLASGGFWTFVQTRREKKDVSRKMLVGLAHDRILYLGAAYLDRGYITTDEYENLHDYLFVPYAKMGGNGSAAHMMELVKKMPMKKGSYPTMKERTETK